MDVEPATRNRDVLAADQAMAEATTQALHMGKGPIAGDSIPIAKNKPRPTERGIGFSPGINAQTVPAMQEG